MERSDVPLYHLLARLNINRRDAAQWHVLPKPPYGHIQGLENFTGALVASNGSLSLMVRNEDVLLVHNTSFIEDPHERAPSAHRAASAQHTSKVNLESLRSRYDSLEEGD